LGSGEGFVKPVMLAGMLARGSPKPRLRDEVSQAPHNKQEKNRICAEQRASTNIRSTIVAPSLIVASDLFGRQHLDGSEMEAQVSFAEGRLGRSDGARCCRQAGMGYRV
jgi:hypothetical protein